MSESSGYKVVFEIGAQKALRKMDPHQANMIMAWIGKHLTGTDDPRRQGKPLSENHAGKWRYRIGDYRLIAHISDKEVIILILEVGHRSKIYQR
ncbi:MAG: type II toxin-antitoxin system RelE/ParE family toxin [Clostridiales Family XIII bacterium]|jgi:mRNA interferase RelE/StbE|nr:type II toxin-antitoxin system RelE/ParE family toxin [Clostridiales Family XIII bacterium]